MSWWKTALFDTCSIITLDKLLLEQADLAKHFPVSIGALEVSFTADQLRPDVVGRMRPRATPCELPPVGDLAAILSAAGLSKALADVDRLVYATAVHRRLSVVTGDKRLAKAVKRQGLRVGNMALVLQELVVTQVLTERACEELLLGLAKRRDLLLGTATPTWADLQDYSFPD